MTKLPPPIPVSAFEPSAPTPASAAQAVAGTVRFEDLSKTFVSAVGDVVALKDISLEIPAGGIFGIIGRSGAGKSSLLRTINRLETPSAGRVLVDGVDIATLDTDGLVAFRRRIGMIFQHFNLLSAKTVFENVALPLRVAGVARAQTDARVRELLELVGLQDKSGVYPSRLSGGQKQRVGIARALATHPEILLCDEATSALDPETTQSILELLRDINRKLGLTVILITHEMSVIREIADQVLVLEQGAIAEVGPVWQVFGAPQHAATRALLAPLAHALPEDLQAGASHQSLLRFVYTGHNNLEPDLQRIPQALGRPVRLVHGGVDRIQGHVQGALLLAVDSTPPLPDLNTLVQGAQRLAHSIELLSPEPHHEPRTAAIAHAGA